MDCTCTINEGRVTAHDAESCTTHFPRTTLSLLVFTFPVLLTYLMLSARRRRHGAALSLPSPCYDPLDFFREESLLGTICWHLDDVITYRKEEGISPPSHLFFSLFLLLFARYVERKSPMINGSHDPGQGCSSLSHLTDFC